MAINPNSPFTRIVADIPTEAALKMESAEARGGKSKKQFIADAIVAALSNANSQTATGKRKSK